MAARSSPGAAPSGASASPPEAGPAGAGPRPRLRPPATLRRRGEFLAAARARRATLPGLVLQARERLPGEAEGLRAGYTCSRKLGHAPARNRARRRLREAARLLLPRLGRPGWDYVLIGRPEATAARPFALLLADLEAALARVHGRAEEGR